MEGNKAPPEPPEDIFMEDAPPLPPLPPEHAMNMHVVPLPLAAPPLPQPPPENVIPPEPII